MSYVPKPAKRRPKGAQAMAEYILVAAIDFGTTYSGYAFSFKSSPEDIKMNKNWGGSVGFQSYKTPTCILINPEGQFDSFGYDAETKYGELVEENQNNTWRLYRHFKMALHSKEVSLKSPISSICGAMKPAIDIFSMSLRFLKDHLLQALRNQTASEPDEKVIKWVITVPAIWPEESKQFMREAAVRAGYIEDRASRQLTIALEPEAASLCCRRLEVGHFVGKSNENEFLPNTKYLVIDSGGGTVDVTAHQILQSGQVRELHNATGGAWGGTKVDERFIKLLEKVLGPHFINVYRSSCPQQWLNLMVNFEKMKRAAKPDGESRMNLTLSWSMGSKFLEITGKSLEKAVKEASRHGVKFANGSLLIEHKVVAGMFEPVVANTVNHIKTLLQNSKIQPCKYFFLVGGFSESGYLQKAIEDNFGDKIAVLIPQEAQMSVIKGAVLFGHCPDEIKTRIARKTYGYRHLAEFDETKHKPEKRTVKEGRELCEDLFGAIIHKGDEIDYGRNFTTTHNPISEDQDGMDIEFYCTDEDVGEVAYVDDYGVQRLGHMHLDMPGYGMDRAVRLDITFGGSEIKAFATDLESNKTTEIIINFVTD